jgi:hypothetical protein
MAKERGVEIKLSLIYIFVFVLFQKFAYIRYEAAML